MAKRPCIVEVEAPRTDLITDIPGNILDGIFMHMPLSDVVRTSILSRKWIYKWVNTPQLDFKGQFSVPLPDNWDPEPIISRILQQHQGPILKFSIVGILLQRPQSIDSWIRILSNHPVEDLGIELPHLFFQPKDYLPPNDLYSFKHLKHLEFHNVPIRLPLRFGGFSELIRLKLSRVKVEYQELAIFFSKCPKLESLDMYSYEKTSIWSLDIRAPNLKCFTFWGLFSSISFASPNIEEISFTYDLDTFYSLEVDSLCWTGNRMIEFFNQLPSLKKAHIGSGSLEFLTINGVGQTLPNNLNCLTILDLDSVDFGSIDEVSSTLCLIRSSPNLQTLQIAVEKGVGDEELTFEHLKEQWTCSVRLNHLKTVDIVDMLHSEVEMEFVKLILAWATTLEELNIESYFGDEIDALTQMSEKDKMIEEVANFHRASPAVDVLIRWPNYSL